MKTASGHKHKTKLSVRKYIEIFYSKLQGKCAEISIKLMNNSQVNKKKKGQHT